MSLAIKTAGRPDIVLPVPQSGNPKGSWFTLKEGSRYSLEFTFQVSNNIVSGLRYTHTVWKTGVKGKPLSLCICSRVMTMDLVFQWLTMIFTLIRILVTVDSTKKMLGTFSPQAEPYTFQMPEETTPSGMFARGSYSARSKVRSNSVS